MTKPRLPQPEMNKLEARYAEYLQGLKLGGEILDWKFGSLTLKIGDDCRYTPDFMVIRKDWFEFHETKGFFRDDAKVKIRVAAGQFPWFKFVLVEWKGKMWQTKEYRPA